MLSEEQKHTMREALMSKSVRELINIIIEQQEDIEEAKQIKRRFSQIQNLLKDPEYRRKPGRPSLKKD